VGASSVPDKNTDFILGGASIERSSELNNFKQNRGFSIVELLIVTSVVAILLVASSSYFSSNIALRRSVDNITANVATTLQLVKLNAARQGVEFRAVFSNCTDVNETDPGCLRCNTYSDYSEGDEEINIIVERGDSNRNSGNWCIQSEQIKEFQLDIDFVASGNMSGGPLAVSFLPTGLRSDFRDDPADETLSIEPLEGAPVDKCGIVQVTAVGGIRVVHGRWDGTTCNAILDPAPTPGPA
jgi:prepilin-type N-terminal cleavage/methylation domain-containing protein